MARKPNYDFEKRRKEQERKAKKDAKRAERLERRDEASSEDAPVPADTTSVADLPATEPPAD